VASHGGASCTRPEEPVATPAEPLVEPLPRPLTPPPAEDGGLVIEDLVVGTGLGAARGDKVSAHYVGTLVSGTEFDSSRKHGEPFTFTLGSGHVIKGWEQGVPGMRVGGKRKLVIPPDLAYGERGMPPTIPPRTALVFEIELVDVRKDESTAAARPLASAPLRGDKGAP
jgi:FKBP-type peptidyl-prolyl cis-trans isomerase FkpA